MNILRYPSQNATLQFNALATSVDSNETKPSPEGDGGAKRPAGVSSTFRPPTTPLRVRGGGMTITDAHIVWWGLIATAVGLWVKDGGFGAFVESLSGFFTGVGQLAGFVAAFAALAGIVLVSRVPWVEKRYGLDSMIRWHKWLGIIVTVAVVVHVVALLSAYTIRSGTSVWHMVGVLWGEKWMPTACVGFVLILVVAVSSWKRIRSLMPYEMWYHIHVLGYFAVVAAFGHVVVSGSDIVGNPVALVWWCGLYGVAVVAFFWGRVVPLIRSLFSPVKVVSVGEWGDGAIDVWVAGTRVRKSGVRGGQYFQVRFGLPGLWWNSHPYSVSHTPVGDVTRFTFRVQGDDETAFRKIHVGTRMWLQGPYGHLGAHLVGHDNVAIIAGGSGIAPLLSLLHDIPVGHNPHVVLRVSSENKAWFVKETETVTRVRGGRMHLISGPRTKFVANPLSAEALTKTIPQLTQRQVFVCGSVGLSHAIRTQLLIAGVPPCHIHTERYQY